MHVIYKAKGGAYALTPPPYLRHWCRTLHCRFHLTLCPSIQWMTTHPQASQLTRSFSHSTSPLALIRGGGIQLWSPLPTSYVSSDRSGVDIIFIKGGGISGTQLIFFIAIAQLTQISHLIYKTKRGVRAYAPPPYLRRQSICADKGTSTTAFSLQSAAFRCWTADVDRVVLVSVSAGGVGWDTTERPHQRLFFGINISQLEIGPPIQKNLYDSNHTKDSLNILFNIFRSNFNNIPAKEI